MLETIVILGAVFVPIPIYIYLKFIRTPWKLR